MRTILTALALVVALASPVTAGVSTKFTVQGVLRSSTGQLQSMMVSVLASLWDSQTAGTRVAGPYGPQTVMAQSGLFTIAFDDPTLVTALQGATEVWMEVTVGSDTLPRQLVTSQLYARLAERALTCAQADAVSCTGCLDATKVATGTLLKTNIKGGELTHAHTPAVAVTATVTVSVPAGGTNGGCTAACASGVMVGGSCITNNATIRLRDSFMQTGTWCCNFDNPTGVAVPGAQIIGHCLTVGSTTLP